jgi:ribosome-associated translation inhibitor RaiA
MKVTIRYRFLNARAIWQSLVERHIKSLEKLATIGAAKVTIERQPDAGPPFRVHALLEVPGPDFHAEANDHTLQAAVLKVVRNLEHQIKIRRARHKDRGKTNRQADLFTGRASMALSGARTG